MSIYEINNFYYNICKKVINRF